MELADCVYNWLVDFFRAAHGSGVYNQSSLQSQLAQPSQWGQPRMSSQAQIFTLVTLGNSMVKFADDTYLIIPALNRGSCAAEIQNVRDWASSNNLPLNHAKSMEIVFVSIRCQRAVVIPPAAIPTIPIVKEIKAVGLTISREFLGVQHIN